MKAIDVLYLESEDISCITIQRTDIVAGQKIIDKNDTTLKYMVLFLMAVDCLMEFLVY
ncbi:hypothetical protein [Ligilactobacillus salivarius]|uniref:hypothetical protein n=1 Tax=Ligilactobacillus salivarius TaxID=1624 RepID=UPI001F506C38|nr:hypothetical protein [Ligilactobacillus salivarius]